MLTWFKTYYNLIFWGILAIVLVGSGWYIKGKLDENTTMKTQITQLQANAADLKALQDKYNALDSKVTKLNEQKATAFAKSDKGAADAFKSPSFTDNRLTPVQLCYWNDFGDESSLTACLSNAGVPGPNSTSPQ